MAAVHIGDIDAALTAPGSEFEMEQARIRDADVRVWKHIPSTLIDVLASAKKHGEAPFLVMDDDRVSYDAFCRAAAKLSGRLDEIGLEKGERVAIAMRNCPEWPVAFFAAIARGAIVVPLNAWWTGQELEVALADCGASILICDEDRLLRITAIRHKLSNLRHILVAGAKTASSDAESLEAIVGPRRSWATLEAVTSAPVVCAPDDDAVILYTSGTSGKPKGAIASHRNFLSCIASMRYLGARAAYRAGLPLAPPSPKALLLVVPLFHVTGCAANMLPHMSIGSKIVLMHRWDPSVGLALIEKERITVTGGVPTVAAQILNHPERERFDLSSLEVITYGGAPAAPDLPRRITDGLGCAAGNGWGMTETCGTLTGHIGGEYLSHPESVGPPVPVADIRIVRDGLDVAAGDVGELWVKGPGVVRGYWGNAEATAQGFVDGWLRTGDLCRIDAEGFVYVVDRLKDVVIRGGENIYCVEVEAVLLDYEGVIDAAVVGIAHDTLGQEPAAVIQLKSGVIADLKELKAFVGARLASYKVPVRIVLSQDPLPRNANGKVLKKELRALFEEDSA